MTLTLAFIWIWESRQSFYIYTNISSVGNAVEITFPQMWSTFRIWFLPSTALDIFSDVFANLKAKYSSLLIVDRNGRWKINKLDTGQRKLNERTDVQWTGRIIKEIKDTLSTCFGVYKNGRWLQSSWQTMQKKNELLKETFCKNNTGHLETRENLI